jgi:hypothetical protein
MIRLNASIAAIPLPARMRHLPVSDKGFPVPWFVQWIDGKPDFRVMDANKLRRAVKFDLCWLCGQTLGRFKVFTIGPMCAVNRTSAEPPSHRDCAEYAVKACPFLTKPRMRRNSADLPEHEKPAGIMLERNPGCTLLWITHDYRVIRTPTGPLVKIGEPVEIVAYAEGGLATRAELDASIASGLPFLAKEAAVDGEEGQRELAAAMDRTQAVFERKLRTLQEVSK